MFYEEERWCLCCQTSSRKLGGQGGAASSSRRADCTESLMLLEPSEPEPAPLHPQFTQPPISNCCRNSEMRGKLFSCISLSKSACSPPRPCWAAVAVPVTAIQSHQLCSLNPKASLPGSKHTDSVGRWCSKQQSHGVL